jgi:hypothetical protein
VAEASSQPVPHHLLDIIRPPIWMARTKRPRSSEMPSPPRSSAQKRTRIGDSKNVKKKEWKWVYQHVRWRDKNHMETRFYIHGVECDHKTVRRKLCRAGGHKETPVEGMQIVAPGLTCPSQS